MIIMVILFSFCEKEGLFSGIYKLYLFCIIKYFLVFFIVGLEKIVYVQCVLRVDFFDSFLSFYSC